MTLLLGDLKERLALTECGGGVGTRVTTSTFRHARMTDVTLFCLVKRRRDWRLRCVSGGGVGTRVTTSTFRHARMTLSRCSVK